MLLLHTGSLYQYGLNRIFSLAKSTGFDGIEIMYDKNNRDTYDVDYITLLMKQYDLPVRALSLPHRGLDKAVVENVVQLSNRMQIPTIIIKAPEWKDFMLVSYLRNQIPFWIKNNGKKVCIENPPAGSGGLIPTYAFSSPQDWKRFQYVCLDTGHLPSKNLDAMQMYSKLQGEIVHIHASDSKGTSAQHMFPGQGVVGLESFFTKLRSSNYQGDISFKIDQKFFSANTFELEAQLRSLREFYAKYFVNVNV